MKMKCRERERKAEERGRKTGLTGMGRKSESYRSNIKEGKRHDEWGGVVQGQVRSSTMGTDRLMHKQERGRINELPSYCTQVWPLSQERKKGETEERESDEGHSWFSRRGGGAGKRGDSRRGRAVRITGKNETKGRRESSCRRGTRPSCWEKLKDSWPRPARGKPFQHREATTHQPTAVVYHNETVTSTLQRSYRQVASSIFFLSETFL